MTRLAFLTTLLISTAFAFPDNAQSQLSRGKGKHKISAQAKLAHNVLHAGSSSMALLIVNVNDGWHINSAQPSDEKMIGTTVDLDNARILDSLRIQFPPAIEKQFEFSETPIEVYEGVVHILLKFTVGAKITPGKYPIKARIGYQACSDNICLAPTALTTEFVLHVVPASSTRSRINNDLFDIYDSTDMRQE